VMQHGARNSLLVAPMPTASTSQVLGNNESFEPFTANVYTRRVLAGEFVCVNKHLVKDLIKLNLWTSMSRISWSLTTVPFKLSNRSQITSRCSTRLFGRFHRDASLTWLQQEAPSSASHSHSTYTCPTQNSRR